MSVLSGQRGFPVCGRCTCSSRRNRSAGVFSLRRVSSGSHGRAADFSRRAWRRGGLGAWRNTEPRTSVRGESACGVRRSFRSGVRTNANSCKRRAADFSRRRIASRQLQLAEKNNRMRFFGSPRTEVRGSPDKNRLFFALKRSVLSLHAKHVLRPRLAAARTIASGQKPPRAVARGLLTAAGAAGGASRVGFRGVSSLRACRRRACRGTGPVAPWPARAD